MNHDDFDAYHSNPFNFIPALLTLCSDSLLVCRDAPKFNDFRMLCDSDVVFFLSLAHDVVFQKNYFKINFIYLDFR